LRVIYGFPRQPHDKCGLRRKTHGKVSGLRRRAIQAIRATYGTCWRAAKRTSRSLNMDARPRTIRDILYTGDQYIIPFFQRHYSWEKKHWDQLRKDIWTLMEDEAKNVHF